MGDANEALRSALIHCNLSAFPLSEFENQDMSETFKTVTSPSENTLLHIAAAGSGHDHENMTTALARKYPFLITMQNSKRDTPLHVAARAGMLETVNILVDCAKNSGMTSSPQIDVKGLMEMRNCRGNTALHEGLNALLDAKKPKNKHRGDRVTSLVSLARSLVSEDPNASYLTNVEDKSPLYLAVESENEDILEYILKALPVNDNCANNLEGKSPVKVAIELQKLDMLKMMHDTQPALLLIKDEQWNTPMHWAASVDHLEEVRFLHKINPDSVLQKNKEGLYPFHLACENGCVRVMGEFFEKENMPHPTELFNNKGQNILHVAAKKGKFDSVGRILKASNIDKLINQMDVDGNTPLHLAALYGSPLAATSLIGDGRAESDIINFHGQTAYDVAENQYAKIILQFSENDDDKDDRKLEKSKSKPDMYNTCSCQDEVQIRADNCDKNMKNSKSKPNENNTMMTLSLLFMVYIKHQLFQSGGTFLGNLLKLIGNLYTTSKETPVNKEDIKDRITNLMIVAALIAGASFAASVQLSSSHYGDSQTATTNTTASISINGAGGAPFALACGNGHAGCDEFQKKQREASWLKVFTSFNTIAMYTSITAAIHLCTLQLLHKNLVSIDLSAASVFIVIALYTSCVAFFASINMLTYAGRVFMVVMKAIQGVFLWYQLLHLPRLLASVGWAKYVILPHYAIRLCFFNFLNWIWSSLKKNPLLCSLPPWQAAKTVAFCL